MIRISTGQDFNFIYELYMHLEVNKYLLYEPMSAFEFNPIFSDLVTKKILYIFEHQGERAGMFKLIPLTHRTSHVAYLGGLAIHPSFGGKGLGTQMMQEILNHAKELGLLRVELSVVAINQKAIRLYEKAGFEKEGVFRKYSYLKNENLYLDEVTMAWLA